MLGRTNVLDAAVPARVPSVLSDLWRRRLDTIISGIANNDTYYLQIANAAEHISAEYHGRFLIELIQNANDQAVRQGLTDSLVTIYRTSQLLAVGNSGQPFDQGKVDAITSLSERLDGRLGLPFLSPVTETIFARVSKSLNCLRSFSRRRKPLSFCPQKARMNQAASLKRSTRYRAAALRTALRLGLLFCFCRGSPELASLTACGVSERSWRKRRWGGRKPLRTRLYFAGCGRPERGLILPGGRGSRRPRHRTGGSLNE